MRVGVQPGEQFVPRDALRPPLPGRSHHDRQPWLRAGQLRHQPTPLPGARPAAGLRARRAAYTVLFAEKYAACSYWALTDGREVPWYTADPSSGFQVRPPVCDPALPQTPHPAGMPVGMADGSVRLVGRSVSPATWYAAHTPAGGEKLGSEPYADWGP